MCCDYYSTKCATVGCTGKEGRVMKGASLIVVAVVLVIMASPALGQIRFLDAAEQTTARPGTDAGVTYDTIRGGNSNVIYDEYCTIGGGFDNVAGSDDGEPTWLSQATVGGGEGNMASVQATVGDGSTNTISGSYATVSGGMWNTASDAYATVGGGAMNTASNSYATVGGGERNVASGYRSTIPGGNDNEANGDYSFAAGYRATVDAAHDGAFLWADRSEYDFDSAAADEFAVRATGGVRLVTGVDGGGVPNVGQTLAAGGSTWNPISARNAKENFKPVDGRDVLAKVAAIPIETWNYKTQDDSFRHIGPMAEDFRAAFDVGDFKDRISSIDADGVALAALQGLYQLVQEKGATITMQQAQIAALTERLAAVEEYIEELAKE